MAPAYRDAAEVYLSDIYVWRMVINHSVKCHIFIKRSSLEDVDHCYKFRYVFRWLTKRAAQWLDIFFGVK